MDVSSNGAGARRTPDNVQPLPVRVLVVDTNDFSRACTVAGLKGARGLTIDSCAAIGVPATGATPDVILVRATDGATLDSICLEQLAAAAAAWPGVAILVVTDRANVAKMLETIRANGNGLLTSAASVESMTNAVRLVTAGFGVFPIECLQQLADIERERSASGSEGGRPSAFETRRITTLTSRQREVLELLAMGCSNKAIAQSLKISESTVKVHIRGIMAQNGVSNRTQIVAHFLKHSAREN